MNTVNGLYDKRKRSEPEVVALMEEIRTFSKKNDLEFNELKWFEYSTAMSYVNGGVRKILDVGSAKSVWPYFLSSLGKRVSTVDIGDTEYRTRRGMEFGVHTLTADICEPIGLVGVFDMITCLSVIEHIQNDTMAVMQLSSCLRHGGVMVISSDFYKEYIEYPDANRTIVRDRPAGSHTDSRVYTPADFHQRVIAPLEDSCGMKIMGRVDFENVDINDPAEMAVRGLYTFGITVLEKVL